MSDISTCIREQGVVNSITAMWHLKFHCLCWHVKITNYTVLSKRRQVCVLLQYKYKTKTYWMTKWSLVIASFGKFSKSTLHEKLHPCIHLISSQIFTCSEVLSNLMFSGGTFYSWSVLWAEEVYKTYIHQWPQTIGIDWKKLWFSHSTHFGSYLYHKQMGHQPLALLGEYKKEHSTQDSYKQMPDFVDVTQFIWNWLQCTYIY